jgi:hypothetical protein
MRIYRDAMGAICVAALAATILTAAPSSMAAAPDVAWQIELGFSSAVERGGKLQKNELTLEPRVDLWFENGTRLTGIGLLRSDFADELEPGQPSNDVRSWASGRTTLGEQLDAELRELYLDFEVGAALVRLGKQQVVWGQADGLRILDVVNPLSYREFILPDFEDRRIPLWMVNVELAVGDAMLQLLWIPDQTYDEFPESGGLFAFTSPRFRPPLVGGSPVRVQPADKPDNWLQDSDVGVRLSAFTGGWDLTANYLFHHQDQAVLNVVPAADAVEVTPTYKRTHLVGMSASKAFGDFVFRSELGLSTDRYFVAGNSTRGFEQSHEVLGVLGLDYSGFTDLFISGQFFQSTVPAGSNLLRPRHERNLSLLVRRDFANDTLTFEVLAIHNTNEVDGLVQAELSYQLTSNITLAAGADMFYGASAGLFGQFDARDRFSLRVQVGL